MFLLSFQRRQEFPSVKHHPPGDPRLCGNDKRLFKLQVLLPLFILSQSCSTLSPAKPQTLSFLLDNQVHVAFIKPKSQDSQAIKLKGQHYVGKLMDDSRSLVRVYKLKRRWHGLVFLYGKQYRFEGVMGEPVVLE